MIKRVTKTFSPSPSYLTVYSTGYYTYTGKFDIYFPNIDDGDVETKVYTYYYNITNFQRGVKYSSINISDIPSNATIVSASLSYNRKGGTYGTTGSSVALRDYGTSASATNIKNALASMSSFSTLRLTFAYTLNNGVAFEVTSPYDDMNGYSLTSSVYFSSIKLTVTYEYETGDGIYYGNNDAWVQCNAYYGQDGAWVPVNLHSGSDDGWSGT